MKAFFLLTLLSLTASFASAHVYCKYGNPYGQVYKGDGPTRQEAMDETIFNCISAGQVSESSCRDGARIRCQAYFQCIYRNQYGEKYTGVGYSQEDAIQDTIFNCVVGGRVNESSCNDRTRIRCN